MTTYFCDGIKRVTILNGVARLEFGRLSGQDIQPVTELIIALPPAGLMQLLSVLERIRDQLVEDGSLQPVGGEARRRDRTTPRRTIRPIFRKRETNTARLVLDLNGPPRQAAMEAAAAAEREALLAA